MGRLVNGFSGEWQGLTGKVFPGSRFVSSYAIVDVNHLGKIVSEISRPWIGCADTVGGMDLVARLAT